MLDPTEFDTFYQETRGRLLLQTYALTGDLPAATSAVRDSFIAAWHHWRKISKLPDAERWVRPVAWAHAQRRHGARIWHRDKHTDPELVATLEALSKLPLTQRKTLLLATLTTGSLEDVGRELGLTTAATESLLQSATSSFTERRGVSASAIPAAFAPLEAAVADAKLPRTTIVCRAGTARRRSHTIVGVGLAALVTFVSGVAVYQQGGVRPSLTRETAAAAAPASKRPAPAPAELAPQRMLATDQLARLGAKQSWSMSDEIPDQQGNGLVLPCQQARYGEPRPDDFAVRQFTARPAKPQAPRMSATQVSELSPSVAAARRTFTTVVGWFASCKDSRTQLVSTHQVDGVGNEAMLLTLRRWGDSTDTMVAGIARTGRVTTATLTRTSAPEADLTGNGQLLAAAVNHLCGAPATGTCAGPPDLVESAPLPTGGLNGMISELDLPPVSGAKQGWVGTEPTPAQTNTAATQCDRADFSQPPMRNALTRTFLFPQMDLPQTFGLTETVGMMPRARAAAFIEDVRAKMAACHDKNLGTDVEKIADSSDAQHDLIVWHLTVEVSDKDSVTFLMGIARSGRSIGQVGFIPAGEVTMTRADFVTLLERAQARLPQLAEQTP